MFFCWKARAKKKRIPVFNWDHGYKSDRVKLMRWIDLHHLRSDPYGSGPLSSWSPTHDKYLKELADEIMKDPKGERTAMDWHLFSSGWVNAFDCLWRHPDDAVQLPDGSFPEQLNAARGLNERIYGLWPEHGIEACREKLRYIFGKLKSHGLELDYYTTQHEWSYTPWAMSTLQMQLLPLDARWPKVEKELGFSNLNGVINFWASQENRNQLIKFGAFCHYLTAEVLDRALYSILKEIWPKIIITDYAHFDILPEHKFWDYNGWPMNNCYKGPSALPGLGSDLNYMHMGQIVTNTPAEMIPWGSTPWHGFILSLNQMRAIKLSSGGRPVHPEFAGFAQYQAWNSGVTIDIYREHVFHAALLGADALQFWNTAPEDGPALELILAELDSKITARKREVDPASLVIEWHPTEFRTTMIVDGKRVTRVTPQNFKGYWTV